MPEHWTLWLYITCNVVWNRSRKAIPALSGQTGKTAELTDTNEIKWTHNRQPSSSKNTEE